MKKTCLGLLLFTILASAAMRAQVAQDMASERHHTLLLEDSRVRVFAVSLPPTDQAFVKHEHNYVLITINDCELVLWAAGQSDILNFHLDAGGISFAFGGSARGMRNDRSKECQMVIVEFLDPRVTTYGYQSTDGGWDFGANAVPPAVDPHVKYESTLSLQQVTLKRVQLLAGDDLPEPSQKSDELMVALTDLDLKLGNTRIRKSAGELMSLPGRRQKLINASNDPARFALIEFR